MQIQKLDLFDFFVIQLCKNSKLIDILTFQDSTTDLLKKCNYLWHPPRALPQGERKKNNASQFCYFSVIVVLSVLKVEFESKQILNIISVPSVLEYVFLCYLCPFEAHQLHHINQHFTLWRDYVTFQLKLQSCKISGFCVIYLTLVPNI